MNKRIKKIAPSSLAMTLAVVYFIVGIFAGILGVIGGLSGANVNLDGPFSVSGNGSTIIIISIFYPFISALGGFIFGFILAFIYNFSVRYTKGLVIEIEDSHSQF